MRCKFKPNVICNVLSVLKTLSGSVYKRRLAQRVLLFDWFGEEFNIFNNRYSLELACETKYQSELARETKEYKRDCKDYHRTYFMIQNKHFYFNKMNVQSSCQYQ